MINALPKQYRFEIEGPLEAFCPGCCDWGPEVEAAVCPGCGESTCPDHRQPAEHGCKEARR